MVGVYEVRWGKGNTKKSGHDRSLSRKLNIHVISDGITRLPILEGEISHIELPRDQRSLGLTIVGGADTPLRCVVVQEIFTDGLVAQDGRLQPGDQIIEVDGMDMTVATHQQVCDALRKSNPVLRLGVYRERIEAYKSSPASVASSSASSEVLPSSRHYEYFGSKLTDPVFQDSSGRKIFDSLIKEDTIIIPLHKKSGRHLGIKLGGRRMEPGIFVLEIEPESLADRDNRLMVQDKILAINGEDIRYARLEYASKLVQGSRDFVSFVVARSNASSPGERFHSLSQDTIFGYEENDPSLILGGSSSGSDRTSECSAVDEDSVTYASTPSQESPIQSTPPVEEPMMDEGQLKNLSMELETTKNLSMDIEASSYYESSREYYEALRQNGWYTTPIYDANIIHPKNKQSAVSSLSQVFGWKREEVHTLQQKQVRLTKGSKEGLGMRIGGGLNSNEGDTPIYVANINGQGPAGKSRQIKKGDVVLSVNSNSLLGLTHAQAVSLLKATSDMEGVTLVLLEGPETCGGAANFVPSWLYWQRLPRALHISKSVILYRPPGSSLGFSIVGGNDPRRGPEPIHVLFVVSTSPAAVDGRLRCGDRLLAVDGRCLESVSHSMAVTLLKQAGERVTLEVVSWMGTEL